MAIEVKTETGEVFKVEPRELADVEFEANDDKAKIDSILKERFKPVDKPKSKLVTEKVIEPDTEDEDILDESKEEEREDIPDTDTGYDTEESEIEPDETAEDKEIELTEEEQLEKLAFEMTQSEKDLSIKDAREEVKRINKIKQDQDGDPFKLAKSNLHLQRLNARKDMEIKQAKEEAIFKPPFTPTVDGFTAFIASGQYKDNTGKTITKDALVNHARTTEPDLYGDIEDDDKVFKLFSKSVIKDIQVQYEEKKHQTLKFVQEKKEEIFNNIKENSSDIEKKYLNEIKDVMDRLLPDAILSNGFDGRVVKSMVIGDHIEDIISDLKSKEKEAYQRGLRDGRENKKIISNKPVSGSGNVGNKNNFYKLTQEEQKRAVAIYPTIPQQTAYKYYYESHIEKIK